APLQLEKDLLDEYRAAWSRSGLTAANLQVDTVDRDGQFARLAALQALFDGLPWLSKATKASVIRNARATGTKAAFLNLQEASSLGAEIGKLRVLHGYGVRMIGLTYNTMNLLGTGCTDRVDAGLSRLGEAFVREMNELGIIVDTAHASSRTTLDACAVST